MNKNIHNDLYENLNYVHRLLIIGEQRKETAQNRSL